MKIQTEQDMKNFCEIVNASRKPFEIQITDSLNSNEVETWEALRKKYDDFPGAQLKQGISHYIIVGGKVFIRETPYIHPFAKTPEDKPELKGSMTGVFVNCVDSINRLALLQIRGKKIESEYAVQNAAAGFGQFRRTLQETARTELIEETGINYAKFLLGGKAVDFLPFMAGGYPQPLASFTFENALDHRFPYCENLEEILEFRAEILGGISDGSISSKKEGHPFAVPYDRLEKIAGELNDQKRFYGPVYDSIINSQRALKDALD